MTSLHKRSNKFICCTQITIPNVPLTLKFCEINNTTSVCCLWEPGMTLNLDVLPRQPRCTIATVGGNSKITVCTYHTEPYLLFPALCLTDEIFLYIQALNTKKYINFGISLSEKTGNNKMRQINQPDQREEYGSNNSMIPEHNGTAPSLSYPFYYYQDFSNESDSDPSVPLTAPGRVPNFPAKMHAILSRDDLSEIIGWMPHGRAWKVFKPREFEVLVLPTYFEHAKFSSFIRQSNGWGFRRINTGCDRHCYYHPRFLRGLPHLCKGMKRPGVAQKLQVNPKHEPDLYKISELHPLPERANKESVVLFSTLAGGAKTFLTIGSSLSVTSVPSTSGKVQSRNGLTPREYEALSAFYTSLNSTDGEQKEISQDFSMSSMRTTSNSSVASSHFYPPLEPIAIHENCGNDYTPSCMRSFQYISDTNKTSYCNQRKIIPIALGNPPCEISHIQL